MGTLGKFAVEKLPDGTFVPKAIDKVKAADSKLVAFVQDRPVAALCGAVAVGYLLGRVLTRL